ncbi:MAG: protein-glutamate O-methyltransferase CheR [Pseudothermotoga sp.]|nr:protein-glutamate O-methyltransferase CheR [Pseudothermotoga sp.]
MQDFLSQFSGDLPMEDFQWFVKEVHRHFGLDLSGYKPHRMKRRIEILIRKYKLSSYQEYLRLLLSNSVVRDEFLDKLTINVTEFFRNPEKWWELRDKYLPELLSLSRSRFKAWSAGCASGEEPYSLAILLEELKAPVGAGVLATDIDEKAIEEAKRGIYESRSMISTPKSYIDRYFEIVDGMYKIKDSVKKRVTFQKHNMLQDPFPQGLDLIVCRNVVIYFEEHAKTQLYQNFAKALRIGGVLFVGSTERIFDHTSLGLKLLSPFFYQRVN